MASKKPRAERADELLAAALSLAESQGYQNISRKQIADSVNVCEALVTHRLGTMPNVRRAIIRQAIVRRNLAVLAQGLAARDPHALKAPDELKQQAAACLLR